MIKRLGRYWYLVQVGSRSRKAHIEQLLDRNTCELPRMNEQNGNETRVNIKPSEPREMQENVPPVAIQSVPPKVSEIVPSEVSENVPHFDKYTTCSCLVYLLSSMLTKEHRLPFLFLTCLCKHLHVSLIVRSRHVRLQA